MLPQRMISKYFWEQVEIIYDHISEGFELSLWDHISENVMILSFDFVICICSLELVEIYDKMDLGL